MQAIRCVHAFCEMLYFELKKLECNLKMPFMIAIVHVMAGMGHLHFLIIHFFAVLNMLICQLNQSSYIDGSYTRQLEAFTTHSKKQLIFHFDYILVIINFIVCGGI